MKILSLIDENGDKNYIGYTGNQNVVKSFTEITYLTNRDSEVWVEELDDLTTIRSITPYELSYSRNQWSIYQVSANIHTKDGWKLEPKIDILHSSYNENIVKVHIYEYISKEFSSIIKGEVIDIEVVEKKLDNLDATLKGYVVEEE